MLRFAGAGYRVVYVTRKKTAPKERHPGVTEISVKDVEVPEDAIVIVQHPGWWPVIKALPNRVIYDCMDHIAGFSTEVADGNERELMAHAELVVVTSDALEREARQYAKEVVVVRNGCDYAHFARTPRAENERPVIGYYGAISDWFDSALVAQLARAKPEWEFLLIGSTRGADLAELRGLRNVILTGERPYAELPEWVGVMDVCIIPFRRTPLTEATNPVKVYEMLAAGRPVVSVPIPEVAALAPLVRLASTAEEFAREIESALADRDDEARRAFAREQTWDARFAQLDAKLRGR